MQTVILAGGKGTRLRPITYQIPKTMVPINGKPFLGYLLEFIKSYGLYEIILLVGYLGDQIEKYFGDGTKFDLNIKYSYENHPLGTGGALKNSQDKLLDEFLLLNGDTFLDIDYIELMDYFHRCNKMATIAVYDNSEPVAPNNIAIGKSNRVLKYNKNDSTGMTHVDAGALVLKKEILNFIPENQFCSLEEDIFPDLIKMNELKAFTISQRFFDIGTFKDLEVIKGVLQ